MRETLIAMIVLAHSWYPWECCSERDCHPIDCAELMSMIASGAVPKSIVKPSLDAECHICETQSNPSRTLCAFRPMETT